MKFNIRYDLGIRQLLPQWKELFSSKYLKEDLFAGISVAFIAIPLSLAIALASGVPPAVGLLTAIVASFVCALFGGTPLAVSGPAAAMSVLIAEVVYEFGFEGLLVVCLACGIMQLISGIVGLGRLIRYMPFPVIAGFTAGIGAIILIGQAPRALGIPVPENSYIFSVIVHIWSQFNNINPISVFLSLTTIAIIFILPRIVSRVPIILIAVVVPSVIVTLANIPVETIGAIPSSLPMPKMPVFPSSDGLLELLGTAFVVYLLASVETLLSSSAVDKISRTTAHDPDQELIGQGLGNIIVSFFGGIPVTGVIARSALNVQSGARTRRASIIHSIVLLASIYIFNEQISQIPIAVLAGVLISVALRMLNPAELMMIWRTDRNEAFVYLGTFFSIVGFDLIFGIKVGILIAMLVALIRLSRTDAHVRQPLKIGPAVVSLDGSITFFSAPKLARIRNKILRKDLTRGLIIDFHGVNFVDSSGATIILGYLDQLVNKKIQFVVKGISPEVMLVFMPLDEHNVLKKHLIYDESELQQFFPDSKVYSMLKLVDGTHKFKLEAKRNRKEKLLELANSQKPHTVLIACSDSRIDTHLMTDAGLGEIFCIRNVGNMIPAYGTDELPAGGAGIEFAVGVLKVDHIIVCGHSNCGAITAVMQRNPILKHYSNLKRWLKIAEEVRDRLPEDATIEDAIKQNILLQLENIRTYPVVHEKLKKGEVQLHGWYYNIATGESKEWDEQRKTFVTIGTQVSRQLQKSMEAGLQWQTPMF